MKKNFIVFSLVLIALILIVFIVNSIIPKTDLGCLEERAKVFCFEKNNGADYSSVNAESFFCDRTSFIEDENITVIKSKKYYFNESDFEICKN